MLLGAIVAVFLALALLLLMIGLIASFFGIIVYLAVFGNFARELAGSILGFLLILKIAIAILLVLAHQRFLQNKGLVLLVVAVVQLDQRVRPAQAAGFVVTLVAGGVVNLPIFDTTDYVGAAALAVERDRLVGVQLHLEIDLLWCAVGDVDADFAHCFDDVWPDRVCGFLAG